MEPTLGGSLVELQVNEHFLEVLSGPPVEDHQEVNEEREDNAYIILTYDNFLRINDLRFVWLVSPNPTQRITSLFHPPWSHSNSAGTCQRSEKI